MNVSGTNKNPHQVNWVKLSLTILIFIIFSCGLAYVLETYVAKLNLPLRDFEGLAYLVVFGVSIVVNISVLPLPFAISMMVLAATIWNPLLIAFFGSLGAAIGECSHYYLGVIGKNVAVPDSVAGYRLTQKWVTRHGIWAIALLSFQPIFPFEIAGFIAGAAKMPLGKFLPALWVGRFLKYVVLIFLGVGLLKGLVFPY